MAHDFRLFVASPGDVSAERDALGDVIAEINLTHGPPLGYRVELLRWETNVAPGAGRPQQVINDQIGSYDVFVGVMWRRFGTPTGVADSGTEEEFRIAYRQWEANPSLILMFYFCQKPFMPRKPEELDQMRQVLRFREELKGKALVWDYDSPESFPAIIRKHLCLRLTKSLQERQNTQPRSRPNAATIHDLHSLWDRMDPELQRAMSVAYNENRRAGDPGIQTRDLFAALRRIEAPQLQSIMQEIPEAALPPPTSGPVSEQPYILSEQPWLSGCVASSIRRLGSQLPPNRTVSAADIFTDIAKNGSGTSVRLLREHNIGPAEIDAILKKKQIDVFAT